MTVSVSNIGIVADEVSTTKVGNIISVKDGGVGTDSLADEAVTSDKISDGTIVDEDINANANIASTKIDQTNFGLTFLGSASLSSANATLSLNITSSPYKFLKIICLATGSSTTNLNPALRFNSDSGANYDRIFSQDSGAASKTAGGSTLTEHSIDNTSESIMIFDVHNEATKVKHVIGKVHWGVDGAVNMGDYHSRWNNTADNITNVSLNATVSTFAAGTAIYVWGYGDV